MNILAFDLGTKCGWALSPESSGVWCLKPSTHESSGQRYFKFREHLNQIFLFNKIDLVVYEEVHAHIGVEAAHVYGGLVAILQSVCINNGIEYRGVSVQTIKKHATSKSSASKDEMVKSAILKFKHVHIIDDNHADVLMLLSYASEFICHSN